MITNLKSKLLKSRSLYLILSIVVLSFSHLGGCNDNNGGNNDPGVDPPTASSCTVSSNPCSTLTSEMNGAFFSCVLEDSICAVDLQDVLTAVSTMFTVTANEDSVIWIEAWGGDGGNTDTGNDGGDGGYAITTTTANDVADKNNSSTVMYYFLGFDGPGGGDHCGSTGGASTIVTFEDLAMNPDTNPTQSSPPILLVAGGGGGGCGSNGEFGCLTPACENDGGCGGIAIALFNSTGQGAGESGGPGDGTTKGGSDGMGGASFCNECGGGNETSGSNGFGGLGGGGGDGQSCTGPDRVAFKNTPVDLSFTAGLGGKGSSNTSTCDAGGGGGGGGWGGGGGGGHGNDNGRAVPGAGGASFAIAGTQTSAMAPTTFQDNPCGSQGCVRISVVPNN